MRSGKWSHTEDTEYTELAPRIYTYLRICFLATNGTNFH